jgi:small-conductance mechanosensitive channel
VVVGLAAQSTLSNLVAGISLVLYRPFKIGDRVQITAPTGPEIGVVESIDLGYTSMRTADGRRLVIPNATIASQTSINLSGSHPNIPCGIAITIASGEDIARARNILLDAAKAVPKIEKVDGCFVTGVTSAGTVLTISAQCSDPGEAPRIKSDLLENAKKHLDAANVKVV